ncbi:MAG: TIM barrel protein [Candidatus Promineifilaceae bacterium]
MMPAVQLYLHTYSLRFHLRHQPGFDVFAFIEQAAAEGFVGVCISANDAQYRHLGSAEPARLAAIHRHVQQHHLACDIDTSGTKPAHLRRMLNVAGAVGAQQLRTYTRYALPRAKRVAQTIRDLGAIAPLAAKLGITVLLENHEVMTGEEIAAVMTAVNHPAIGALFDYGNSQMVMEEPAAALASMVPFSRSAHLKDHVMLPADESPNGRLSVLGVPIGEGYLPIIPLTKALLDAGCSRIAFENSWGYYAPVKPERLTGDTAETLGQGAFRFAQPPVSNRRYLLYPDRFSTAELVRLEDDAHLHSLTWLKTAFAKAGIKLSS